MAKPVDAADLKSAGRKAVGVQVPLPLCTAQSLAIVVMALTSFVNDAKQVVVERPFFIGRD